MKSIYEIQIPVKDQEQANRLKAICFEYGLPIWDDGFELILSECYRHFQYDGVDFWIGSVSTINNKTESTEEEFINILKEMKNGN